MSILMPSMRLALASLTGRTDPGRRDERSRLARPAAEGLCLKQSFGWWNKKTWAEAWAAGHFPDARRWRTRAEYAADGRWYVLVYEVVRGANPEPL